MAAVINTNYLSLVAQNNLNKSQSALGNAIERLSSGLRINSAKDDAAGLAIANRFTANVRGLTQAARNANDGISLAQTTEGASNEVSVHLQRIRELSLQAQNGTYSGDDLASMQAEINQRLDDINRISEQTDFNGVRVLSGETSSLNLQVGARDGETITVNLREISVSTLGLDKLDITKSLALDSLEADALDPEIAARTISVSDVSYVDENTAAGYSLVADATDPESLFVTDGTNYYAATYNTTTGVVEFDTSAGTVAAPAGETAPDYIYTGATMVSTTNVDLSDTAATPAYTLHGDSDALYVTLTAGASTMYAATIDDNGVVRFDSTTAAGTTAGGLTAVSPITDYVTISEAVPLDTSSITDLTDVQVFARKDGSGYVVSGLDADGNQIYRNATVDMDTGVVTAETEDLTADPLDMIDQALNELDTFRSDLGAIQNRLESTVSNLNNVVNNLSAARSRIEDADYAVEVSNMTRAQILQQAGTSVLAQANQVPQTVLSLLG